MLERNRIPAEPVVAVIRDYLGAEERKVNGSFRAETSIYLLAERADMHGDTLQKIVSGRNKTIDFDVADRLLCVIGKADMWYGELRDVYAEAMFDDDLPRRAAKASGEKVCARRGCSETFVPPKLRPGQKYCSTTCCGAAFWQRKHKVKTRLRGKGRHLEAHVCKNGHERTAENTEIKNGVRRCLICKRKSCNASAARRRVREREERHVQ